MALKFRSSVFLKMAVIGMAVLLMLTSMPITQIEAAATGPVGTFKGPHGSGALYLADYNAKGGVFLA